MAIIERVGTRICVLMDAFMAMALMTVAVVATLEKGLWQWRVAMAGNGSQTENQ
jgi:hypothetical protein